MCTCIMAAGPEFMPDIRKSSGSLSYGGSSYQWPIWCGLIDPLAASSYMYVSSKNERDRKEDNKYLDQMKISVECMRAHEIYKSCICHLYLGFEYFNTV